MADNGGIAKKTKRVNLMKPIVRSTVQEEALGDGWGVWCFLHSWKDHLFCQGFSSISRIQSAYAILGFIFLSLICKMHFQLHNNCSTCMTYMYLEIRMSKPKFITSAPKAATPGDLRVLINGTTPSLTYPEWNLWGIFDSFLHPPNKLKISQLPPKRLLLSYSAFCFHFCNHLLVNTQ